MCPTALGRKEKKLSNVHIVHWSAWMKRYWSSMMMIQHLNGDNDASNENSEETKCVHFNNWVIVRAGKP